VRQIGDFAELAALLAEVKGCFLMSINDVPEIRQTFSALHIEEVTTTYSIGENRTIVPELFISNYVHENLSIETFMEE